MKKSFENIVIYDLFDTYCTLGSHSFKIVLDKQFKNGHNISVKIFDPNNVDIPIELEIWGRKINCTFLLNDSFDDGVYLLKIKMGTVIDEIVQFWIIK